MFVFFVFSFVLLVTITIEKDPIKSNILSLPKPWHHVKKFVEYDPTAKVAGGDEDEYLFGDDMTWVMIVSSVVKFPVT